MNQLFWPRDPHKHSVLVTQRLEDFATPREDDPRFPRKRIRSFLKAHGYRGPALDLECDRVMAGPRPELELEEIKAGTCKSLQTKHPYGWQRHQMPRLWRRMFHGSRTSLVVTICLDEYHLLPGVVVDGADPNVTVQAWKSDNAGRSRAIP